MADEAIAISVIAPDHTGLTVRAQPTLYWYAQQPVSGRVEVTLQDERAERPALERTVELKQAAGVMSVDLGALGVRLEPGNEYRWSVAVVRDPDRRSRDVLTSATIMRVPADGEAARAAETPRERAPFALAAAGLWYDAIAALGEAIARDPGNAQLRRERAALLEQVGLDDAAAFDRAHAGAAAGAAAR